MQRMARNSVFRALLLCAACGSESSNVAEAPSVSRSTDSDARVEAEAGGAHASPASSAGARADAAADRGAATSVSGRAASAMQDGGSSVAAGAAGAARAEAAEGEEAAEGAAGTGSAAVGALADAGSDSGPAADGGNGAASQRRPSVDGGGGPDAADLDAGMPVDAGNRMAPACDDCCPDGFPRGASGGGARRIAELTPSPEGVAVCPDGEVYVARDLSGELWHVPMDGRAPSLWAALGDRRPAGLTCDEHGRLFVATFSSKSGEEISLGAVLITGRDATPIELPQPSSGPDNAGLNGIVAVPGVGVYASDTTNNSIILMQEDVDGTFHTRTVATDVSGANGLAYHAEQRMLYANASLASQLLSFRVGVDGALGAPERVSVSGLLLFMDGVAVDEEGVAYVADWLGGSVVNAKTGDRVATIASPASLAFRGGTLLVTDYKLTDPTTPGGLYAVELGVCGGLSL